MRPTLQHRTVGAGDALLLISGFAFPAAMLDLIARPFAQRYQCVPLDHRASGASHGRYLLMTTAQMAADAVRVLDALTRMLEASGLPSIDQTLTP